MFSVNISTPKSHDRQLLWDSLGWHIQRNGQINGFARAIEIPISFVIWFSLKFRSWMILFGSLLDQFVSSFGRANVLSIFEFDADWFIDFSTGILINRFDGLETLFLSLIYKNPRSRFMLESMLIFVSILNFETRCSNSAASLVQWWVRRYCSSSVASFEDQVC